MESKAYYETIHTVLPNSENTTFSMIDLFAGCGGLSLGFEQEGFQPLLFSEINLNAAQTYMLNRANQAITPYGDIYSLTNDNLRLLKEKWLLDGVKDIDLVAGGPPCQGYSGIGHRRSFKLNKSDIPSNHLFQEMVRVVEFLRPKVFLFENVKGLLSGRWTKEGSKGEIFRDVLAAFQNIDGYECCWDLLYAKDYGVPQNRPRTIIIGYRDDIYKKFREPQLKIGDVKPSPYSGGGNAVVSGLLPSPLNKMPPTLDALLSDLIDPEFVLGGVTLKYPHKAASPIQKKLRTNQQGRLLPKGAVVSEHEYSKHSAKVVKKFEYMLANGGKIAKSMQTKKFAQRVLPAQWNGSGPNITATSLPDDYVHFSQPRVPTVREWARIQTFPDWYQFAGPRTTGGRRRAGDPDAGIWDREVPKYTQIGNAVPVILANQIAKHVKNILMSD